jgi:acyl-CoA synthetase (AMP-forming)/AMP-acid ligase II
VQSHAEAIAFWGLCEDAAFRFGGLEALVDEQGRRVTFAELRQLALDLAATLAASGIHDDSRVSWQLPTRIDAAILTLALSYLGAIQIPVIPAYGERDLAFMLRQSRARILITTSADQRGSLEGGARRAVAHSEDVALMVLDDELSRAGTGVTPPPGGSATDATRWLFFTSGTTATPKAARHTDHSVIAGASALGTGLRLSTSDRIGMAFPIAHIGGCTTWLGAALAYGCTLLFAEAFDPDTTTRYLQQEGVTIPGTGTVFTQAYLDRQRRDPEVRLFARLRTMTSGAAPKPPTLHDAVRLELGGAGVMSSWGMTEAPILTMTHFEDLDATLATTEGSATDQVEILAVAPTGEAVSQGQIGELRVKGPQVMQGYLDPALDGDAFDDAGFLRTGDLGYLDENGNVTITGRLKDVIIRRGESISAAAVENALGRHPAVAAVAVVGLPDARTGERCCAVVVPTSADEPPMLPDLVSFLKETGLRTIELPEELVIVSSLPRNALGKVVKQALRDQLQRDSGLVDGSPAHDAPNG